MYERNTGPTALYRLRDAQGVLLYVGITCQPEQRLKQHSEEQSWWPQVADRSVDWFETRIEARRAERTAIKGEGPIYNRQDTKRYTAVDFVRAATMTVTQPARAALDDLILLGGKTHRKLPHIRTSQSVALLAALKIARNHVDEYKAAVAEAQEEWEELCSRARDERAS